MQPPLCSRWACIQPLADIEAVTLSAAHAMLNFQHLTIIEIQETYTARVEMDPNIILQQCGQCSFYWSSRQKWSSVLTISLKGSTGAPMGSMPYTYTLSWKLCNVSPSGKLCTAVFWVPIFMPFYLCKVECYIHLLAEHLPVGGVCDSNLTDNHIISYH